MRPDRVAADRTAAGVLAFTRVGNPEVVDVAVRLGVDAVAVAVVAIDLVGAGEIEAGVPVGRDRVERRLDDSAHRAVEVVAPRAAGPTVGTVVGRGARERDPVPRPDRST